MNRPFAASSWAVFKSLNINYHQKCLKCICCVTGSKHRTLGCFYWTRYETWSFGSIFCFEVMNFEKWKECLKTNMRWSAYFVMASYCMFIKVECVARGNTQQIFLNLFIVLWIDKSIFPTSIVYFRSKAIMCKFDIFFYSNTLPKEQKQQKLKNIYRKDVFSY